MSKPHDIIFDPAPGWTEEEHLRALKIAQAELGWRNFVVFAGIVAATAASILLTGVLPTWARVLTAVASVLLVAWAASTWTQNQLRRNLATYLRERGANICSSCGYELSALPAAPNCPECGGAIATMPAVGSVPRLREPRASRNT